MSHQPEEEEETTLADAEATTPPILDSLESLLSTIDSEEVPAGEELQVWKMRVLSDPIPNPVSTLQ